MKHAMMAHERKKCSCPPRMASPRTEMVSVRDAIALSKASATEVPAVRYLYNCALNSSVTEVVRSESVLSPCMPSQCQSTKSEDSPTGSEYTKSQ